MAAGEQNAASPEGDRPPPAADTADTRTEAAGTAAAGTTARTLIIAEIGTGHNGEIERANELIAAAAEAGADCAKFQYVIADEILHPATGNVALPGGEVDLYRRFKTLERPPEFYAALAETCRSHGIEFLCTPFGCGSAAELERIGVRRYKIASPELNHAPLLRRVAGYGRPIILSTGVSQLGDIERAVAELNRNGALPLTLLHCITAYPAPEEQYNLRVIPLLSRLFGVPVGVSDHSRDPLLVPAVATALAAAAVEKHITLSPSGGGLDDPIAVGPTQFRRMVEMVRQVEQHVPVPPTREAAFHDAAVSDMGHRGGGAAETALDLVRGEFGAARVHAVLGDGRKRLAQAEQANYGRSNRSLHAVKAISAGSPITADAVAVLRTEHTLTPGLSPWLLETVVGAVAARDIADGVGLCWDDLVVRAPAQ